MCDIAILRTAYLCRSSHNALMRIGLRSIGQYRADENGILVGRLFGIRHLKV